MQASYYRVVAGTAHRYHCAPGPSSGGCTCPPVSQPASRTVIIIFALPSSPTSSDSIAPVATSIATDTPAVIPPTHTQDRWPCYQVFTLHAGLDAAQCYLGKRSQGDNSWLCSTRELSATASPGSVESNSKKSSERHEKAC